MGKKITSVFTIVFILFLFTLLINGLINLGEETALNPNANLDNSSIDYILKLKGINRSARLNELKASQEGQERSILVTGNQSQANPKDYALDFLFAKQEGWNFELIIKRIFGLPSFVIVDLMQFPLASWEWFIDILGWLLTASVIIALIYFARNRD